MPTKTLEIDTEFMINRKVWRTLGYSEQPSKVDVGELMEAFLAGVGVQPKVKLKYMGAPGHYRMRAQVAVSYSWWKSFTTGKQGVISDARMQTNDFLERVATGRVWSVGVSILKK